MARDHKKMEQKRFWAGKFGDNCIDRSRGEGIVAAHAALFGRILNRTQAARDAVEFGANIDLNLEAISILDAKYRGAGNRDRNMAEILDRVGWLAGSA